MQFKCCICGKPVQTDDKDAYTLQVRRMGTESASEMIWGHGRVLRKAIPVIGEEIAGEPQSLVGVTVRRERRWTSAGATPARELVRSTR